MQFHFMIACTPKRTSQCSQSIIVRTNELRYLTKTETKQSEMLDLRKKLINKELTVVERQQNQKKKKQQIKKNISN